MKTRSRAIYLLLLVLIIGTAWAYHTRIDIAVRAPGIVRPDGEVARVVAEAGGRITRIYVGEGSKVREGDPLLQLDVREVRLRLRSLESKIHFTELRLAALEQQVTDATALDEQSQNLDSFETELRERGAQASVDHALVRFNRSAELLREGLIARQVHDEAQAALTQAQADLTGVSSKSLDLKRAQSEVRLRRLSAEATPLRAELTALYDQLEQTRLELDRLTITSPVNGQIASFATLHPNELLTPGTLIATFLPESHTPIVESWLPSTDRRFVALGQSVRLQSDAFPPDQYDIISGIVLDISPDARITENLKSAYRIRIQPDAFDLHPGMTFQVQYITHQERLLWLPFIRVIRAIRGVSSL